MTIANWVHTEGEIGLQPIETTDTVQNHPLGYTRVAKNITTAAGNEGTFVYLKGVASTVVSDLVVYDNTAGTTTRAIATTSRGPAGVAMSANVASQYGWYQVEGSATINISAGVTAGGPVYLTGVAGQPEDAVVATDKLDGARWKTTAASGTAVAEMAYCALNGNG